MVGSHGCLPSLVGWSAAIKCASDRRELQIGFRSKIAIDFLHQQFLVIGSWMDSERSFFSFLKDVRKSLVLKDAQTEIIYSESLVCIPETKHVYINIMSGVYNDFKDAFCSIQSQTLGFCCICHLKPPFPKKNDDTVRVYKTPDYV